MREILFRGKTYFGDWCMGDLVQNTQDGEVLIISAKTRNNVKHKRVKPETIGQFTGLTDKNGKKIFEGDIVKIHRKYLNAGCEEDCLYEVIWHKNWCGWALRNLKPTQCCYLSDAKEGEIIGNKWDNPELLGE